MSEVKPTPGPWAYEVNGPCYNLRSPDRSKPFLVLVGMTHNTCGEFAANVRLIAAAPDLLEACKSLYETFEAYLTETGHQEGEGGLDWPPCLPVARQVIAKAEPEE